MQFILTCPSELPGFDQLTSAGPEARGPTDTSLPTEWLIAPTHHPKPAHTHTQGKIQFVTISCRNGAFAPLLCKSESVEPMESSDSVIYQPQPLRGLSYTSFLPNKLKRSRAH